MRKDGKDFLKTAIDKKIKTSFIGAIAEFEKSFGFLWGHNENLCDMSQEQIEYKKLWDDCRSRILNTGNKQIRGMEKDIERYDVVIKTCRVTIMNKGANKDEGTI